MSHPSTMRDKLQNLLDTRFSVRQFIYVAVMAALIIGLPYGTVGLIWATTHMDHIGALDGLDKLFSVLGEIVAWPVLIIADVSLR